MDHRHDIDGLRAIAIGAVIADHAFPGLIPGGFVGVDIFFVISGFLITSLIARDLAHGRFSILSFYERRARRILPALCLLILVWTVIGWYAFPPDIYAALGKSSVATLGFFSNIWFWHSTGGYFALGAQMEPLLHTWSLGVEEQFYLVFPLLLAALWPLRSWRKYLLWGIMLASLLCAIWGAGAGPIRGAAPLWSFYWLPSRAWELGVGAALALSRRDARHPSVMTEAIACLGVVSILLTFAMLHDSSPFPGLTALPVCLGTAAILWAGGASGRLTYVSRVLGTRPLVGIGLISYSLYLWHWPPLVLARLWTGSTLLPAPLAFMMVVVAGLAAFASWAWVEQPFRNRQKLGSRFILAASPIALGLLMGAGLMIHHFQGFTNRLPSEMAQLKARAMSGLTLAADCERQTLSGKPCRIGDPDALPTFVIWGDSHAMALLPGFEGWLQRHAMAARAYVHAGCPPLPSLRVSALPDCAPRNEQIFEDLRQSTPQHILLSARWSFARSGTRLAGETGGPLILTAPSGQTPPLSQEILFDQALEKLVAALTALGHDVTIIGDIPEIGADVQRLALMAGLRHIEPVSPRTYKAHSDRSAGVRNLLHDLSEDYGISVRDPAEILCHSGGRCRILHAGYPLYRDDDHLTADAAGWLIPRLLPMTGASPNQASRTNGRSW